MKKQIIDITKSLADALKSVNGIIPHKQGKKPTGSICDSISVMVITFEKTAYDRDELDGKSDIEKYAIALGDTEHCKIYGRDEYVRSINDFKPMERFAFTYIVTIPTRRS